jgi:pilus assembly protein CpaB
MKAKTLVLMFVAIGCGLVASYMTSRVIAERNPPADQEKVTVLVAKKNVSIGTLLKDPEDLFEEKAFTKGEEPKKAIRTFDELREHRLNKPITAEQFVTADDLSNKDDNLTGVLPPGMRAVAIKVDATTSVSGFVTPNSRVDIISTVRRNDSDTVTKILLQNVLVLAVDSQKAVDPDKPAFVGQNVTVAVTPKQAETLALAGELGTLRLALRGWGDDKRVNTAGTSPKNMYRSEGAGRTEDEQTTDEDGGSALASFKMPSKNKAPKADEKKPAPPPEPKFHTMLIQNGNEPRVVKFELGNKNEVKDTKVLTGTKHEAATLPTLPGVTIPALQNFPLPTSK